MPLVLDLTACLFTNITLSEVDGKPLFKVDRKLSTISPYIKRLAVSKRGGISLPGKYTTEFIPLLVRWLKVQNDAALKMAEDKVTKSCTDARNAQHAHQEKLTDLYILANNLELYALQNDIVDTFRPICLRSVSVKAAKKLLAHDLGQSELARFMKHAVAIGIKRAKRIFDSEQDYCPYDPFRKHLAKVRAGKVPSEAWYSGVEQMQVNLFREWHDEYCPENLCGCFFHVHGEGISDCLGSQIEAKKEREKWRAGGHLREELLACDKKHLWFYEYFTRVDRGEIEAMVEDHEKRHEHPW